jgi:hypothetical protein
VQCEGVRPDYQSFARVLAHKTFTQVERGIRIVECAKTVGKVSDGARIPWVCADSLLQHCACATDVAQLIICKCEIDQRHVIGGIERDGLFQDWPGIGELFCIDQDGTARRQHMRVLAA